MAQGVYRGRGPPEGNEPTAQLKRQGLPAIPFGGLGNIPYHRSICLEKLP